LIFLVLGRGKMGRLIADVALERGHTAHLIGGEENRNAAALTPQALAQVDVVIDFTTPAAVIPNLRACLTSGSRVVVGTTGWYEKVDEMRALCEQHKAGLLYGANFSVGVQVIYHLAEALGRLARGYSISIDETHHAGKKDVPSGTAYAIKRVIERANSERANSEAANTVLEVEIASHREGEAMGTHVVTARSADDLIEIKHEAFSRRGFAEGALRAAEWLAGKTGCYDFSEIYPRLG
jgi:4-hydroxy-tetrahydrodipicolinate reductase